MITEPGPPSRERDRAARIALIAVPAAVVMAQTITYLLGAYVWHWRFAGTDLDLEASWFGKVSAVGTMAAGVPILVFAVVTARSLVLRLMLGASIFFLGFDDLMVIHERIGWHISHGLGLGDAGIRLAWPAVYFPFLAIITVLLLRARGWLGREGGQAVVAALGLLVFAVFLEVASYGITAAGFDKRSWPDVAEVILEEGSEIGGWLLILTAMLVATVRQGRVAAAVARVTGRASAPATGVPSMPSVPALAPQFDVDIDIAAIEEGYGQLYAAVELTAALVGSLPLAARDVHGHAVPSWLDTALVAPQHTLFIGSVVRSVLLRGNAYAVRIGDDVVQLHPDRITPWAVLDDEGNDVERVYEVRPANLAAASSWYQLATRVGLGQSIVLGRDRVLHLPGAGFDGLEGHSTLSVALRAPAPSHAGRLLNIEQATALLTRWQPQPGRTSPGELVALSGDAGLGAMTATSGDADILATRRVTVEEMARSFGVPSALLRDAAVSAGIDATMVAGWRSEFRLDALLTGLEHALSGWLPEGQHATFDRADRAELIGAHQSLDLEHVTR